MKPNREVATRSDIRSEKALSDAIAAVTKPDELHALLIDLCTPAELQALADRWNVVLQLQAGKAYRTIQAETGVSVTTIGRVARCLNQGAGGYHAALSALAETE